MAPSKVAPTHDARGRFAGGNEATGQFMTSKTGRWLALLAAVVIGWGMDQRRLSEKLEGYQLFDAQQAKEAMDQAVGSSSWPLVF